MEKFDKDGKMKMDILERLIIHMDRMEDRGIFATMTVCEDAHKEIEKLRTEITTLTEAVEGLAWLHEHL